MAMTPLDYATVNALTAGSAADAIVAEALMGYHWGLATTLTGYEGSVNCLVPAGQAHVPTVPPAYTTDLSLAYTIAVLSGQELLINLDTLVVTDAGSSTYDATFTTVSDLPLAICKSALFTLWTLTPA